MQSENIIHQQYINPFIKLTQKQYHRGQRPKNQKLLLYECLTQDQFNNNTFKCYTNQKQRKQIIETLKKSSRKIPQNCFISKQQKKQIQFQQVVNLETKFLMITQQQLKKNQFRSIVHFPEQYPFSAVAKIVINYKKGKKSMGCGYFIHPQIIFCTAHQLFNKGQPNKIEIFLSKKTEIIKTNQIIGTFICIDFQGQQAKTKNLMVQKQIRKIQNKKYTYDYGFIFLKSYSKNIQNEYGTLGLNLTGKNKNNKTLLSIAYSNSINQMETMIFSQMKINLENNEWHGLLGFSSNSFNGQSGSPIFNIEYQNNKAYFKAIYHKIGFKKGLTVGKAVNKEVIENFQKLFQKQKYIKSVTFKNSFTYQQFQNSVKNHNYKTLQNLTFENSLFSLQNWNTFFKCTWLKRILSLKLKKMIQNQENAKELMIALHCQRFSQLQQLDLSQNKISQFYLAALFQNISEYNIPKLKKLTLEKIQFSSNILIIELQEVIKNKQGQFKITELQFNENDKINNQLKIENQLVCKIIQKKIKIQKNTILKSLKNFFKGI